MNFNIEQFARKVAEEYGIKPASSGQLKELAALQKRHKAVTEEANYHSSDANAVAAFVEHQKKMIDEVEAGKFREIVHRTVDDFRREFRAKAATAYDQRRVICQLALPIIGQVAEVFATEVRKIADAQRKDEAKDYKRFNLQYEPSKLVELLEKCAQFAVNFAKPNQYQNASPAEIAPYLNF